MTWDPAWTTSDRLVGPYCVILGELRTTTRFRMDPFCLVTTQVEAGDAVQVCSHVAMVGGPQRTVHFKGWNFVAYHSRLICGSEDFTGDYGPVNAWWGKNRVNAADITFEKFSGVCSNVTVMPGVVLPEGCVIGAGALVRPQDKLEPWAIKKGALWYPRNRVAVEAKVREWSRDTP